ncbi:uncharacterized protein L969DRAFT_86685 [Mixia osmundae IAM 14324]|uniref:ATP-dependent DNA ligase family profile domain-containing protein n=1 Tax=Mixia osmundae (strain CBS 9802 / IAM 14324 / JCM 22182 / KY 12970) TaxID=764103 RepID=G7E9W3_MIXOS|nr:uncharacterized protein L969DRAFT_86685 [Mixia osmundae IAM 14324]KEI40066.1 hypothetical protein L969DRAFT_86685 [Mixia osmundae IAM 14324]GAA99432.1 hypothetical protein E5Q_06131 [Mixia osmundae IAM 14324]
MSDAPRLTFADLCRLLDELAKLPPSLKGRIGHIRNARLLFESYVEHVTSVAPHARSDGSGARIFRLLFPEHDVRVYGLQATTLGKLLFNAFGGRDELERAGMDEGLHIWASNKGNHTELRQDSLRRTFTCLGQEAELVRNKLGSCDWENPITLQHVCELLDELSWNWCKPGHTEASRRKNLDIFKELIQTMTARQLAWIVQIMLKDLRPLLWPIPSADVSRALADYNQSSRSELQPHDAMRIWHWAMPDVYRVQADLQRAATLCERLSPDPEVGARNAKLFVQLTSPELGQPVEIPKCGRFLTTCASIVDSLPADSTAWLETKYDGFRMQIHFNKSGYLKLISKQGRDCTEWRRGCHSILRAAILGTYAEGVSEDGLALDECLRALPAGKFKSVHSGILEAELVPFDERQGRIAEFTKMNELCEYSRNSDQSRKPDFSGLHFHVVFFDCLMLNKSSYLNHTYAQRRAILEQVVRPLSTYSSLAARRSINLAQLGREQSIAKLRQHMAFLITDRQEGMVIKADKAIYNSRSPGEQWIKLKKDYIKGLGDTADFAVIGASWSSERAVQLGVPTSCFTTYWIGVQTNRPATLADPTVKAHFVALFTVSYGMDRSTIDATCKRCQASGLAPYRLANMIAERWPFAIEFVSTGRPDYVLKEPMLFELMGAGFVRKGPTLFELRFPRVKRVYGPGSDRTWHDAMDIHELRETAQKAIAVVEAGVDNDVSYLWSGKKTNWTPFEREVRHWMERLERAETPRKRPRLYEEAMIPANSVLAYSAHLQQASFNHPWRRARTISSEIRPRPWLSPKTRRRPRFMQADDKTELSMEANSKVVPAALTYLDTKRGVASWLHTPSVPFACTQDSTLHWSNVLLACGWQCQGHLGSSHSQAQIGAIAVKRAQWRKLHREILRSWKRDSHAGKVYIYDLAIEQASFCSAKEILGRHLIDII